MELWRRLATLLILLCLFSPSQSRDLVLKHKDHDYVYNHTLVTTIVEYASAVYMSDLTELFMWTCTRCNDKIKEFEIIELIVDVQNCLQAFVGYAEDLNSIVIAFRGTQERSLQNWIEDLFWKQLDIDYPGMPDAMVHYGFYSAYHNTTIRPGILKAVKHAKKFYGNVDIIVTGHSLGGAMASFCALDLTINHGSHRIQLVTFGQPRVGNAAFASYFHDRVPETFRITNDHDIVPHLPPYYSYFAQKTYHHFPREVWLYKVGLGSFVYDVEKICDDTGEDPSCCRSVTGNSISDHLKYFGVELRADKPGSCTFVVGKHISNRRTDRHGNFVLSKDPVRSSLLRYKTPTALEDISYS